MKLVSASFRIFVDITLQTHRTDASKHNAGRTQRRGFKHTTLANILSRLRCRSSANESSDAVGGPDIALRRARASMPPARTLESASGKLHESQFHAMAVEFTKVRRR